ncbi:MAG: UDP-glucose--hexose-1-phosphate uridylyltransferase [Chloroflexi bacterium]|nr:UDP-glucose--hexose-1-phosphate uridylyltransferase [Chloroflexota bacterium]MBI3760746.1 UDP-glucose--hexose-1-phosphate uridylyltransferase [Chloroflexota bacterium]
MLDLPHRRLNLLTREWVLVSPHRAGRPWLGQVEKVRAESLPPYDPTCYLCPDNERAGGVRNPAYETTFVFDNDFAAILPDTVTRASRQGDKVSEVTVSPVHLVTPSELFKAEPTRGLCRVICFSPRHDLTLPELSLPQVEAVILTWADQTRDLGERDFVHYVQVFENKGEIMGASNPHPHSQVWASSHVPNEPAKELAAQSDYLRDRGTCLLCDYLVEETKNGERIVAANDHFTALVPFWAVWPFELLLIANDHVPSLPSLSPAQITSLADLLRRVTARYDNLFEISFPYSMGFHQAPTDAGPHGREAWHLHAHFYPPLLRSATIKKFMVGYEMLAMPQRDITAETAAERLRGVSERHYRASS